MAKKGFFARVWAAIKRVFISAGEVATKVVPLAIAVVEKVKTFVDGPAGDVITALIPGEADDRARDLLRVWLPKLLTGLALVPYDDHDLYNDDTIVEAIRKINAAPADVRKAFYHGLAALLVEILSDGKVDWSEAVALKEYVYKFEI